MKIFIIILFFFLFFADSASAHGGFEKRAGSVVVYVLQAPISPYVGEEVKMYFTLKDESIISKNEDISEQNLVNFPVELSVIDTYYGDETRDKVILKKQMVTDANGAFSFTYTFNKENYFDIDLSFIDRKKQKQEVGFLIQPRKPGALITKIQNLRTHEAILLFGFGCVTALFAVQLYRLYVRKKAK